jgi:PTH1 family peptidyl-tRNA hydrolase
MKFIVGLGNPGKGYSRNRHNTGFIYLNHFARQHSIRFDKKQASARTGSGQIDSIPVVLAKPQTFMNSSGKAVSQLVRKFNIDLDDLIVIHDDLDLPLGKIRIRKGSTSGGHKGVDSVINELGSQDFIRIRVGIGRPEGSYQLNEADIIDYVLSDFTPEERKTIDQAIPRASEAIVCLLTKGLEQAMNKYN